MYLKNRFLIVFIFLFSCQSSFAMEDQENMILPITINVINNDGKVVYATYCLKEQLRHLGTLDKQYSLDKTNPLIVPQEYVCADDFQTIDKITLLVSLQAEKKKQKKEIRKCFKEASEQSDYTFIQLLRASNYLNAPLLMQACTKQLYNQVKSLYTTNLDQATALLKKIKIPELSVGLGNYMLEHSPLLQQLFLNVSHKTKIIPEAALGSETNTLCYDSQGQLFCGLSNGNLAILSDNKYYLVRAPALPTISFLHHLHNDLLFFANRNQYQSSFCIYDFQTDNHKIMKRRNTVISAFHYSSEKNLLYLVQDDLVEIFDPEIKKTISSIGHDKTINTLTCDAHTNCLFLGCNDCIDVYSIEESHVIITTLPCASKVTALCLSKNRKTLFAGDATGTLSWWDLKTNRINRKLYLPPDDVPVGTNYFDLALDQLKLSPDGILLAATAKKGWYMKLIDTREGHCIKGLENGSHHCMDFSPDGKILATKGNNCILLNHLHDQRLAKKLKKLPAAHVAVLDYCAHASQHNQLFDLSEKNQELFDQLPKKIKRYFKKTTSLKE